MHTINELELFVSPEGKCQTNLLTGRIDFTGLSTVLNSSSTVDFRASCFWWQISIGTLKTSTED